MPPWQCPECGPCRLLRVPLAAPGGTGRLGPTVGEEAGPLGVRPLQWVHEVVSAASAVDFMAFDPAARRGHPVFLCEFRAEEGRRRVVSSCVPHSRRLGAWGTGAAIFLRCGEHTIDRSVFGEWNTGIDGVFARSTACPFFVLPVRDELSENERRDGTQPRALGAGPLLHGPPRAAQSGTHRRWLSPQLPSHWAAAAGGG